MTKKTNDILMFAAGFITGGIVSFIFTKKIVSAKADEEIDSVVESFENLKKKVLDMDEKAMKDAYKEHLEDMQQFKTETPAEEVEDPVFVDDERFYKKAEIIAPEEFGETEYDTTTYTYYSDGFLCDERDVIVDGIDQFTPNDIYKNFGKFEDDAVHIRSHSSQMDIEVLLSLRTYREIAETNPYLIEEEDGGDMDG